MNKKPKHLHLLLFLFMIAVIIRLIPSCFVNPIYWIDAQIYNNHAQSILLKGYFIDPLKSPGYPYFLSLIYFIFNKNIFFVILIQSLLGGLSCLFLYKIGCKLFNAQIGITSGYLLALYPFHIYLSSVLLTENLFIFLFLLWIYLLLYVDQFQFIPALISGLLLGFLTLVRSVGLILIPVWCFYIFIHKRVSLGKKFLAFSVVLLTFFLTNLPWSYVNQVKNDRFILSSAAGGLNFWRGNNPLSSGSVTQYLKTDRTKLDYLLGYYSGRQIQNGKVSESDYYMAGWNWIKKNPVNFFLNYFLKFINFWRLTPDHVTKLDHKERIYWESGIIMAGIYIFALGGIILHKKFNLDHMLIYILIFIFPISLSFFITSFRYRMIIDPLLLVYAASFISKVIQFIGPRVHKIRSEITS